MPTGFLRRVYHSFAIIQRVNQGGEAWFGATVWNGMRVMRISVTNFRTTAGDIDRAIAAFKLALEP